MSLSLNEIEATAKKAARGAGYPWGLAEEAGKATRWLCSRDVDGCRALAELLRQIDGQNIASWSPGTGREPWTARGGLLCPLATGAAISDHAHRIEVQGIRLGAVAVPVLLMPFAALLSHEFEKPIEVVLDDLALCTDGEFLSSTGVPPSSSGRVSICFGGPFNQPTKLRLRADPDPSDWETLLSFAHRTYAPATEESRLKGAGGNLPDNN